MITIARIINSWRDAEQFQKPVEDRSDLWHLLIFPQYAFAIFAVPAYMLFIDSTVWLFAAGLVDIMISWAEFEFFLKRFRIIKNDNLDKDRNTKKYLICNYTLNKSLKRQKCCQNVTPRVLPSD